MRDSRAFTLIEVIIAGAVLGAVVFAILRMSTNNEHQVSLLETEKARRLVEYNIEQCMRSLGYDAFTSYTSSTGSISFWTGGNDCITGSTMASITLRNYSGNDEVTPTEIENTFTVETGTTYHTITIHTASEKNAADKIVKLYK